MLEVCSFLVSLEEFRIFCGLFLGLLLRRYKKISEQTSEKLFNYRKEITYWISTVIFAYIWSYMTNNMISRYICQRFSIMDEFNVVQFGISIFFGYVGVRIILDVLELIKKLLNILKTKIEEKIVNEVTEKLLN